MAGLFYTRESHFSPDTCGCVLARDESRAPDDVWLSSQYVYQCDEHAAANCSAVDVHAHNVSKNFLLASIDQYLPHSEYAEIVLSPMTKGICFRHPKLTPDAYQKIAAAFQGYQIVNLTLVSESDSAAIFVAYDAFIANLPDEQKYRFPIEDRAVYGSAVPVFWHSAGGRVVVRRQIPKQR